MGLRIAIMSAFAFARTQQHECALQRAMAIYPYVVDMHDTLVSSKTASMSIEEIHVVVLTRITMCIQLVLLGLMGRCKRYDRKDSLKTLILSARKFKLSMELNNDDTIRKMISLRTILPSIDGILAVGSDPPVFIVPSEQIDGFVREGIYCKSSDDAIIDDAIVCIAYCAERMALRDFKHAINNSELSSIMMSDKVFTYTLLLEYVHDESSSFHSSMWCTRMKARRNVFNIYEHMSYDSYFVLKNDPTCPYI